MRIRYIKPGFFHNDTLCQLGPWHRLTFVGLWCLADKHGRLKDSPRWIAGQLFPFDDVDMGDCLDGLAAHGFIVRYEAPEGRFIAIPKWNLHQRPHPKETDSGIPAPKLQKHSVKKQSREIGTAEPGKATAEPVINRNENRYGNENGNGDGKDAPSAPARPLNPHAKPTNLINGHEARRHGTHGWCDIDRGLCVPAGLHLEFQKRSLKSHAELAAWYASVVANYAGQPVGDDAFDFWRNSFAAWIGTATSKPRTAGKGQATVDAFARAAAKRIGGGL